MKIELSDISKRYKFEWILKRVNYTFEKNKGYAVTGPNGSGKSTLLKMISGHLTPSKGKITYTTSAQKISKEDIYTFLSFASPYIDLIEEFTLVEAIDFHAKFQSFQNNLTTQDLLDILQFKKSRKKEIRHFSSGMKQRLKLLMAITTNTPILLLDEPTTNLDRQGMDWYLSLIDQYRKDRLIIVASNIPEDFQFCEEQINILNYK